MEIIKTKSPIELLEYLEKNIYNDFPKELWDDTLFFYGKLLTLMSLNAPDELFEKMLLHKIVQNKNIIAISIYDIDTKTLYFIGETMDSLKELLSFLKHKQFKIETIILINDDIALDLMKETSFTLNYSDLKFYKKIKSDNLFELIHVKEINKDNAHYLWDGITDCIEEGIRYFGGFLNDEIKCCAGISRISKTRSEIIAVHTFLENDRNKGYASNLCSYLINLALENVDIVTWTAGYTNIPSINTAKKIGMKHSITIFNFKYSD